MAIAYKIKKAPRKRLPILEWLFPKMIRETSCKECGRPFLEHPDREPTHRFEEGNVELFLYEDRTVRRKEYKLRVGVWRTSHESFHFSQLYSEEHLEDLGSVVSEAIEFVKGCKKRLIQSAIEK